MTEFKDALDWVDEHIKRSTDALFVLNNSAHHTLTDPKDRIENNIKIFEKIRRDLRIADRLMQEPSEGMMKVAIRQPSSFKAMRDQMIKEIDDV